MGGDGDPKFWLGGLGAFYVSASAGSEILKVSGKEKRGISKSKSLLPQRDGEGGYERCQKNLCLTWGDSQGIFGGIKKRGGGRDERTTKCE